MTSAFTYKGDSTAQSFDEISANLIGYKGQWLIIPGLLEGLTAV